jgi:hypothetical protein
MPSSARPASPFMIETGGTAWSGQLPTGQFSNSSEQPYQAGDYGPIARNWIASQSITTYSDIPARKSANRRSASAPTQSDLAPDSLSPAAVSIFGLQKWTGEIVSIDDGFLTVELFPLDHEGQVEVASFELRLLGPDISMAQPGGIVYLTTRSMQDSSGYVEAMTNLRLRRPRRWSQKELSSTMKRARERAKAFEKHANRTSSG